MSFLLNPHISFGGFKPSDIPGLRIWMDAQDNGQLSLTGSSVNNWDSKDGAVTLSVSNTGSNRPTTDTVSGKQMIRFTAASNQSLAAGISTNLSPGTGAISMFLVSRTTDTARATVIATGPTGTAQSVFMRYNNSASDGRYIGQWRDRFAGVNRCLINDADVNHADGSVRVHFVGRQISAGKGALYTDNVASSTNPIADTSGTIDDNLGNITLGQNASGTDKFNGHIGEVIIYFRELTTGERTDVYDYLKDKWGL